MLNKRNNFLLASLLHFLTSFLNRTCMVHPKRKVMNIWVTISGQWKSSPFATRVRWRIGGSITFLSFFYADSQHQYFQNLCFLQKKNPDTNLFFFLFFIKVNHKCSCLFTKMSEMKNHQFLIWGLLINKAR